MNIVLWIIQILLALLFLFAGGMKLIVPTDVLMQQAPPGSTQFSSAFFKFIGLVEVLGGLGLILPGLFHRRPELTPLAAAGLVILMIGAVAISVMDHGIVAGVLPLVTGLLCLFVAYGRWKLVPHRSRLK
ncbi:MAG TPA: DoxX family protein [Pyrinomonadaceae bacterium]|nr:DoxX family protein [Pyrinomonadaceae bacterium]